MYAKKEWLIHKGNLKQALNQNLSLRKVNKAIKFNQEPWLKPSTDTNQKLRKSGKYYFEKAY